MRLRIRLRKNLYILTKKRLKESKKKFSTQPIPNPHNLCLDFNQMYPLFCLLKIEFTSFVHTQILRYINPKGVPRCLPFVHWKYERFTNFHVFHPPSNSSSPTFAIWLLNPPTRRKKVHTTKILCICMYIIQLPFSIVENLYHFIPFKPFNLLLVKKSSIERRLERKFRASKWPTSSFYAILPQHHFVGPISLLVHKHFYKIPLIAGYDQESIWIRSHPYFLHPFSLFPKTYFLFSKFCVINLIEHEIKIIYDGKNKILNSIKQCKKNGEEISIFSTWRRNLTVVLSLYCIISGCSSSCLIVKIRRENLSFFLPFSHSHSFSDSRSHWQIIEQNFCVHLSQYN